jgi:hypothetical protein
LSNGADDEGVVTLVDTPPRHQLLRRSLVDRDLQARLRHDLAHRTGFLADAVGEFDAEVGAENRKQHPGDPTAGADIEDALAAAEMAGHGHRIGDVARHEPLDVGVTGEVEPLVPGPQAAGVHRQPILGAGWHRERQPVTLGPDGPGECRRIERPDGGFPPVGHA